MNRVRRRLFFWALLALGVQTLGKAQVEDPFTVRFGTQQTGGIVFLANASLSCGTSNGCSAAQASLPITGNAQENNNAFDMAYIDVDGVAGTWSSSSDSLALGTCAEVVWAGLYWAGRVESTTPNYGLRDEVKIGVNGGAYVDVVADELFDYDAGFFDAYFCFADVTDLVAGGPAEARFSVANVVAQQESECWGGWTLVVVYADALAPMRNMTVFDGFAFITNSNPYDEVDVPIAGFVTPPVGPVDFQLGIIAYDGDRGSTGDQMGFNGGNGFQYIADATHPIDNAFNSTHATAGVLNPWRIPAYANTLGHDANIYTPNNAGFAFLGNGATSAVIRASTGGESIMVQTLTSVIDVYEPDLRATVFIEDLNGGLAEPGDILEYTVVGKNVGSDVAVGTYITDTLDLRTTYLPGSLVMLAGPGVGPMSDAPGDDRGEYVAAAQAVRVRVGSGSGAVGGGSLAADPTGEDSVAFRFRVTLTEDCLVLQCNGTLTGIAHIFGEGDISGNAQTNGGASAITDANGCPVDAVTEVSVSTGNCAPVEVTPVGTVCLGDDVELFVPAFGGNPLATALANYSWSGPGGFSSTEAVALVPGITPATEGVYSLEITFDGLDCLLATAAYTLDIHVPNPAFDAPADQCITDHAFDFIATGALYPGAVYAWTFEGGATAVGAGIAGVTFSQPGWQTVTLELTELGCTAEVSDSVFLEPMPVLDIFPVSGVPAAGCVPVLVSLADAGSGATLSYLWNFGDGTSSTNPAPVHIYDTPGTYDLTVSAAAVGVCTATVQFVIEDAVHVQADPVAGFELEPNVVDVLDGEVTLTSLADPATTCTYWISDGGSLAGHFGVYTFLEGGTFEVVQTVVDALGCTATARAEVAVNGTIFFAPSAFSPDGNGLNDVWLPTATGTTAYRVDVFNRWGERVWSSEDPRQPWLGQVNGGTHYSPDGLYHWTVLLYDQLGYPRDFAGTVVLLR